MVIDVEIISKMNELVEVNVNLPSPESLDKLLSALPERIYIYDKEKKFLYANIAGAKALGVAERQDVAGKSLPEFSVSPGIKEPLEIGLRHVLDTGRPFFGDIGCSASGGNHRLRYSFSPIAGKGCDTGMVLVIVFDAERKKPIDIFKGFSETPNNFKSVTDAFYAIDNHWRFTYLSLGAEELLERKSEELIGKVIWDEFPGLNSSVFDAQYRKAKREMKPVSFEAYYPSINCWAELHAYPHPEGLSVYFTDVTKRKQVEKDLRRERRRVEKLALAFKNVRDVLQGIMESADAHIAYLDSEFNFIMANSAYEKGSGYTRDGLIGRNYFKLFPDKENETVFREVKDAGEAVEFRARNFKSANRSGKGIAYWDWALKPIKDGSGIVTGLVLSLVDVTESVRTKQLSDAFSAANEKISAAIDPGDMMQIVLGEAAGALHAESAALVLCEDDRLTTECIYGVHNKHHGDEYAAELGKVGATAATTTVATPIKIEKTVAVSDTHSDGRVDPLVMKAYGICSLLIVPLILRGEVIGMLNFNYHSASHIFTQAEIDFVDKLAMSATLAYENLRLSNYRSNVGR